jgi:uncharacterized protein (DUF1810 family)
MTADPFDLERFITAQSGTYEHAVAELRRGQKASHWMWFVFPQIEGLGQSATSKRYAISSLSEARAYLADPVLGPRLRECASILLELSGRTAVQIFGNIDAQKLRSSMTLFHNAEVQPAEFQPADPSKNVFQQVLDRYFGGTADSATMERL